MTTLNLGVIELPYTFDKEHTTTGQVAEILENKYHVFEIFYELHKSEIAEALSEGLKGSLESLIMGAPVGSIDPFQAGNTKIEEMFKKFLSTGEIEKIGIPGVPTKAALDGKSKRFKKGVNKKGRRPSFIDTGLYESAFKAWVEGL